jgi:hypothetical protein
MTQLSDTGRSQPAPTGRTAPYAAIISENDLRRITNLISLGFGVLMGLIGLRFLLHLMAANPGNPFMLFIDVITTPFLWMFQGLTWTPAFEGITIEFYDLIAIPVYYLLNWTIVRLMWILLARRQ